MKTTKLLLLSGIFASLGMLASCADDDLANGGGKNDGDKGTAVTFNVSNAQDDAQNAMVTPVAGNTRAFAGPVTRVGFANGLAMQGLTPEDLTSQKLPVSGADNACLIETTTAGVNPPPCAGGRRTPNPRQHYYSKEFAEFLHHRLPRHIFRQRHHAVVPQRGHQSQRHPRNTHTVVVGTALWQVLRRSRGIND